MKFKLLEGSHRHQETLYEVGSVIETDLPLDKAFPARFEKITEAGLKQKPLFETEPAPSAEETKAKVRIGNGILMDDAFDFNPEETGLHVYRRGYKYYLYDLDDLEVPLNDKGLKKSEVLPFIESMTEG